MAIFAADCEMVTGKEKECFLSSEKKQKIFSSFAASTMPANSRIVQRAEEAKVFCFFSSEKKGFLASAEQLGPVRQYLPEIPGSNGP